MKRHLIWIGLLVALPWLLCSVFAGLSVDMNNVCYLSFDRYQWDRVFDNSPHHNNATLGRNAFIPKKPCQCGHCAELDGGDIRLQGAMLQGVPYVAITVMMMVWLEDTAGQYDLFHTNGSVSRSSGVSAQIKLRAEDGKVRWMHRNEKPQTVFSIVTKATVLEPLKWSKLAVTYNGLTGTSQIYVDGKLNIEEHQDPGVFLSNDWSSYAGIGTPISSKYAWNKESADPFHGYVDEFYIFNKSLSVMELASVTSLCESKLVFKLGFDRNVRNVFNDDSGFFNDATLSMPIKAPGKKPEEPIPVNGSCGHGIQITGPTNDLKLDGLTFRNKPIDAVTIALWFKATSIKGIHYLFNTIGGHSQHKHDQYDFSIYNGCVRWIHHDEMDKEIFSVTTDPVITEKLWFHIAVTYNATTGKAKVYINGNINKEGRGEGKLSEDWDGYAGFGRHAGTMMDFDVFDEIYMYNREIDEFEVKLINDNCDYERAKSPPNTFQPVMFFGFDRTTGKLVYDDSGSDNHGRMRTIRGYEASIVKDNGTCGRGLQLNGGNMLLRGSTIKRKPLLAVTIALWVKLASNRGAQTIFMTSSPDNPETINKKAQYVLGVFDGRIKWFHSNEKAQTVFSSQTGTPVVPAEGWTHIAVTYSSMEGRSEIFVNGVLMKDDLTGAGTLSQDWGGRVSVGKFMFKHDGVWAEGWPLIGLLDEFYIYDRALMTTEINLLMETCDFRRIILDLGFEEFRGKTTLDRSGLANNGEVLNAAITPAGKCGKGLNMTGASEIQLQTLLFNSTHFKEKPQKAISISVWVKLHTNRGNHEIFNTIGSRSLHKHDQYRLAVENGKVIWFHHQERDIQIFNIKTNARVPARNWTHITATYCSNTMLAKIYVNGKFMKEKSGTGDLSQDWGQYAGIGRRFYDKNGSLKGELDNFMMFNYAINEKEIGFLTQFCNK